MAENVDDLVLKQLRLIPETLGQIEGRLHSVYDKIDDLKTGRQQQTGMIMALAGYIRDLDVRVEHLEAKIGGAS